MQFFTKQYGMTQAWMAAVDEKNTIQWIAGYPWEILLPPFSDDDVQKTIETRKIHIFKGSQEHNNFGLFPLDHEGKTVGLLGLIHNRKDYFQPDIIEIIASLSKIIAHDLFEEERKNREVQAEIAISRILQSSLDARNSLPAVLEILSNAVKADVIIAQSYNPFRMDLEILAIQGKMETVPSIVEAGSVGDILFRDKAPIWIEDLQSRRIAQRPIHDMTDAGFRGYVALPLIGHNDPCGVLEILWRAPIKGPGGRGVLERVAEQIAFVMERSAILKDFRQINQSLASGYEGMIEALSRTLELRDFETEGHTRRVSLLTMRLVEYMKIPPEQWEAIRQGALLHDIGKLGVPDAILLKPGSLTDDEKAMMQLHVLYGYNILAPIINSRHILDIVLHHHERWDGTGYPHGLRGLQIPMVARLFAVVDVFDALTSDRPYRTSWSREQALEYIKQQAGCQFDPQVVKYFLEVASEK